jgi:hypothetical protein
MPPPPASATRDPGRPAHSPPAGVVDRPSVSELAEQAGRDAATLALRRAQLALAEQPPELRGAARAAATVGICAVALLSAFVFGNWALASALASPLPGWRAPLVLAAAWLAAGGVIAAPLLLRWSRADRAESLRRRQQALEEAEQTLRETLDGFADAIAVAAEERIAAAILPLAGGMVEVGEGMVEATDDVLEAADEITDVVEEVVPGGIVVNRAVDLALAPGRLGVRVARRALTLGRDDD